MHECFPKTLAHGNSKNEIRQETEEGKKTGMSTERAMRARKKEVQTAYHYLIKIQY